MVHGLCSSAPCCWTRAVQQLSGILHYFMAEEVTAVVALVAKEQCTATCLAACPSGCACVRAAASGDADRGRALHSHVPSV